MEFVMVLRFGIVLLSLCGIAGATAQERGPAEGESAAEVLRLGERMCRQGGQTDGKPMRAIVAGDCPDERADVHLRELSPAQRSRLGGRFGHYLTDQRKYLVFLTRL